MKRLPEFLDTLWALEPAILERLTRTILRIEADPAKIEDIQTLLQGKTSDEPGEMRTEGDFAIIPIEGIIVKRLSWYERFFNLGTEAGTIERNAREAANEERIKAAILAIDSPGGSIAGIAQASDAIYALAQNKPVVAVIPDIGASAAYWLASQADKIIIGETAQVGSVGVYSVIWDQSKLADDLGIKVHIVRSGEMKGVGEPGAPITKRQLDRLQGEVDDAANVMYEHIARGRDLSAAEVKKEWGDGDVYLGQRAIGQDLADELGTFAEAVEYLRGELGEKRAQGHSLKNFGYLTNAADAGGVRNLVSRAGGTPNMGASIMPRNKASTGAGVPPTDAPAEDETKTAKAPEEPKEPSTEKEMNKEEPSAKGTLPKAPPPKQPEPAIDSGEPQSAASPSRLDREPAPARVVEAMQTSLGLEKEWADEVLAKGLTREEANQSAIATLADARKPIAINVGLDREHEAFVAGVVDAILIGGGLEIEKPHDEARKYVGRTLLDLGRMHLQRHGFRPEGMGPAAVVATLFNPHSYMPDKLVCRSINAATFADEGIGMRAAAVGMHSTSDFPYLLAAVANKSLAKGYTEAPSTWQVWMNRTTFKDFKNQKRIKLGEFPSLDQVKEGEEYTFTTFGEEQEEYAVLKYGKAFAQTWEMVINDDLSGLVRVPLNMGNAARRLENVIAYYPIIGTAAGQVMADGYHLFDATNHANLVTAGAAPSAATLAAGRAMMRKQTGMTTGVKISPTPRYLIVPVAHETAAEILVASMVHPDYYNQVPMPPFIRSLTVVAEPLLDLDAAYAGSSDTAWYLAAGKNEIDTIEVAFLAGNEAPFLEEKTSGTTVDGKSYKVRHVIGSRALDWRGLFCNDGVT